MVNEKKERPKHLGRGLQSLLGPIIPDRIAVEETPAEAQTAHKFPPDNELRNSLREISVEAISPNPYQARTVWDDQELADLAESIRANGVIQP
ncbi:MAG: ParB N-terminal domain-containing protein, partial [Planctomycetota bacterium]